MTRILIALTLTALPTLALALPGIGDVLGTNPTDVTAALTAAGCPPTKFEAERGKVEVKCTDTATGRRVEFYLDPTSGAVTKIEVK